MNTSGDSTNNSSLPSMEDNQPSRKRTASDEEFVRLFGLHQGQLFAYITTLLPRWADVEDVLQRTSIVLWRKFDQFDPATSFIRWACAVAYWESLGYLRQEGRRRQVFKESVLEKIAETRVSHGDLFEKRHLWMDGCVAKLPASDREIIERYYYQEKKTVADVARELDRPTDTVLHALVRIRGALQRCIDEAASQEERQ
jgi:RNA polymerase sigma-70 factor, ECF subfamily